MSVLHLVEISKKNYLYCPQKKNPYSLCPFHSSTLSVTTTVLMVKNNQVQVCDDVILMIVDGIYNTDGDGDYESFHSILESNFLGPDDFDCDNDRELAYANRFEDYNWINVDQSSIIISSPSLSQKQLHHRLELDCS